MKEYEGIPMDPHMFDHLIGRSQGTRNMHYTWRDVSLYALGVGAGLSDTPYIYERAEGGLKPFPTFALLPYINNITMDKIDRIPHGTNEFVRDWMEEKLGYMPTGLHMAMELTLHEPIDPYQGTFITEDRLNNVYDRGEGKGVVCDCAMEVYNIASRKIATLHSYHYNKPFGGFGGETFVPPKMPYPDRKPDYETTEFMAENIAAIYRLCGDTYENHIDPKCAKAHGFDGPFTMGLCTYGFATRMAIQQVMPYQPERVTYLYAQIRNVCYPGCNVTMQTWKAEEEGTLYFKLLDDKGRLLLTNGIMKYKV